MASTVEILVTARDRASGELRSIGRSWERFSGTIWATTELLEKAGRAVGRVYETLEDAARIDATANTFEHLAASIDTTAEALNNELSAATDGMVGNLELMQASNQFVAMGLAGTTEEAGKLAEIGTQLGLAFRGDAAAGMEEFALLLANQSIPRLDTFGISAGRVRTRIAELQAETPGLTRETAFLQATMEEAEKTMAKVGDQSQTAAGKLAGVSAHMNDLWTAAKQATAEGLEPLLEGMLALQSIAGEGGVSLFSGWSEGLNNFFSDIARKMTAVELYRKDLIDFDTLWKGLTLDQFSTGLDESDRLEIEMFDQLIDSIIDAERFAQQAEQAFTDQASALREARYWAGTTAEASEELADAQGNTADAAYEMNEAHWDAWRAMHGLDHLAENVTAAFEDLAGAEGEVADQHERTRQAAREAARATAEAAAAAREAAAASGDLFSQQVQFDPEADPLALALYEQADAAGASMETLALLGVGLGLFSEDAAIAAIKTAAVNAKVRELGQAVADGDISIGDAIERLGDFQETLDGLNPENAKAAIGEVESALARVVGDHEIALHIRQYGQISAGDLGLPGGATLMEVGPGESDGSRYRAPESTGSPLPPPPTAEELAENEGMYRAAGGPVVGGRGYIVGEKEPEFFFPSVNGAILNGNQMSRAMGGQAATVNVTIGTIVVPSPMAGSVERIAAALGDQIGRSIRG